MLNTEAQPENRRLFQALHLTLMKRLGPKEETTLHSVVGFELGGPPDLLMFRDAPGLKGVTYVTCDLLWCQRQPPSSRGRYELAVCLPTESPWAEHLLFKLSHASLEQTFEVGHTVDISDWVEPKCPIKGLFVTKLVSFKLESQAHAVLFFVGVTRAELDYALENGAKEVATRLHAAGFFPVTVIDRESVM